MLWWFSYNWTIYGNPVEFAVSDYSAGAQQHELWLAGLLPTKGNPGLSVWTFGWSVLETAGIVLIVLALIGAITTGDSPLKIVVRYRLLTLLT